VDSCYRKAVVKSKQDIIALKKDIEKKWANYEPVPDNVEAR